jgi:ataxia telangiectasia mutated family protein
VEEEIAKPSSTQQTKLIVFKNIEKHFHPVFRYFFWEHYRDPAEWYEKRTAYICSIASNSMLGYILGLGDRHAQNILIDQKTAEVIHIDLGIAFEQGKMLTTPELVPFRLTRDIVDGMGPLGTQGLFQKSCQRTLSLLRTESETLLAILNVLKYDPLYKWTVSPLKMAQIQASLDTTDSASPLKRGSPIASTAVVSPTNREAERALIRVKEKLMGYEDGVYLCVEGQVNALIQTAQDPALLCLHYPGWSPWL